MPIRLYFLALVVGSYLVAAPISILTFREIYESLSLSTNVNGDQQIFDLFSKIKEQLPKYGKLSEYGWSSQKNLYTLSSAFCKAMISKDQKEADPQKRWAHQWVNFKAPPQEFTPDLRSKTLENYGKLFWGRVLEQTEESEFLNLLESIATEEPAKPQTTYLLCLVGCTAVASAPDFWIK